MVHKMKKVMITKEGYLIEANEMVKLSGEIMLNIRMNCRMLKRIGRLSYKEHKKLESLIDSVIYPIQEKKK